jgi:hypothetical protein
MGENGSKGYWFMEGAVGGDMDGKHRLMSAKVVVSRRI